MKNAQNHLKMERNHPRVVFLLMVETLEMAAVTEVTEVMVEMGEMEVMVRMEEMVVEQLTYLRCFAHRYVRVMI